jgi:hypothetical protein
MSIVILDLETPVQELALDLVRVVVVVPKEIVNVDGHKVPTALAAHELDGVNVTELECAEQLEDVFPRNALVNAWNHKRWVAEVGRRHHAEHITMNVSFRDIRGELYGITQNFRIPEVHLSMDVDHIRSSGRRGRVGVSVCVVLLVRAHCSGLGVRVFELVRSSRRFVCFEDMGYLVFQFFLSGRKKRKTKRKKMCFVEMCAKGIFPTFILCRDVNVDD